MCAILVAALGLGVAVDLVGAQLPDRDVEHSAIAYSTTAPRDAIARLQQRLERGDESLAFDATWGYLPSLLRALDIPASSQGLVFSKTSLQVDRIGPWAPRALYFGDDVYLGWVQGGAMIEVASVDPVLGTVFYVLPQDPAASPRFTREGRICLMCHQSPAITGGVPGLIVRSVVPDRHGYPLGTLHDGSTTDGTPMAARWGGWYATGRAASRHMGNVAAPVLTSEVGNIRRYLAADPVKPIGTVESLSDRFDTTAYLSGGHSDLVALLLLSHQAQVHNLMSVASYEARIALHEERLRMAVVSPADRDRIARRIRLAVEPLVRAMLFADEQPLTGGVRGTSSFAAEFSARGPRDARGRSLRDLDLDTRLLVYPLSYLVYSEAFDALPPVVRSYVYERFRRVLGGGDAGITHLSQTERQAILEILTATKPAFAASVSQPAPGH